ncbi:hypothetical protein O181_116390, partial [Austropuccinia psidii MF-1]|nr:hypothetical protein [Austropuccinia psidii MF-1]
AIRPVISPRSLVTKCTTCISAWRTCALHPPFTFNEGLTATLLGDRTPLFFCLTPASPFSVAAFAATELQFCPHALKLRLLQVLQLLRLSQLHHGIKNHLHTTSPSLSFSPTVVLLTFKSFGLERFYFVSVLKLSNSSCCALYAPSGVSPAFVPRQQPALVMLADKHTRNVHSLSAPSDHTARGVLSQDALARTPLWLAMMKPYPSANGHWDPKPADGNDSGQLALSPQVSICPPPPPRPLSNGHFTP